MSRRMSRKGRLGLASMAAAVGLALAPALPAAANNTHGGSTCYGSGNPWTSGNSTYDWYVSCFGTSVSPSFYSYSYQKVTQQFITGARVSTHHYYSTAYGYPYGMGVGDWTN